MVVLNKQVGEITQWPSQVDDRNQEDDEEGDSENSSNTILHEENFEGSLLDGFKMSLIDRYDETGNHTNDIMPFDFALLQDAFKWKTFFKILRSPHAWYRKIPPYSMDSSKKLRTLLINL